MEFPLAGPSPPESSSQYQMTITINDADEPPTFPPSTLQKPVMAGLPLPATARQQQHQQHVPLGPPPPAHSLQGPRNLADFSPPALLSSPTSLASGLGSPASSYTDVSESPGRHASLNRRNRPSSSHVGAVNIPPPANPVRPVSLQGPPLHSPPFGLTPPQQSFTSIPPKSDVPSSGGVRGNPSAPNKLSVNTVKSPTKTRSAVADVNEPPSSPSPLKSAGVHQLEKKRQAFLQSRGRNEYTVAGPKADLFTDRDERPRRFRPVQNWRDYRYSLVPSGSNLLLRAATSNLLSTYMQANPNYAYALDHNPRRVLTKPSQPMHNQGRDNADYDFLLYVNDIIGSQEGQQYRIMDVLGQGTFGQVAKCMNLKTREAVAVKVIKNKQAYHTQSLMEVAILELLNLKFDPQDVHHFVRMTDHFMHQNHLCIVFEMLSVNLYELLKQNSFRGLSTNLVRIFVRQILESLIVLNKARIIHCDLKPENVLLKNLDSPNIKVIDFGSACHENQTVYTYIQSRFYRSPEVVLGLPYTSSIDMWSLGCIAGELFLGLPLFPGSSEYNLISRITEMMGLPPVYMCEKGKSARAFFQKSTGADGRAYYSLKPPEQFMQENGTSEQPSKRYFSGNTLSEVIGSYPMGKKGASAEDLAKENRNRTCFIDFLHGLLKLNPFERWTPQQAIMHPFMTGEAYTSPYIPQAERFAPMYPPGLGPTDPKTEYREPPKRRPRANTSSSLQETLPPQLQRLAAAQKRDGPTYPTETKPNALGTGSVYHSPEEHPVETIAYQSAGMMEAAAPERMVTPRNMDSPSSSAVSVSDSQYVSARQSTMSSVSSRSFGDDLAYDGMRPPSGARLDSGRTYTPRSSPYSTYAPPSAAMRDVSPGVRRTAQVTSRIPSAQDDRNPLAVDISSHEPLDTVRGIAHVTQQVGDITMGPAVDLHPAPTVAVEHHVRYADPQDAGGIRLHEHHSETVPSAGYPLRKTRSETVIENSGGPGQRYGHAAAAHMFPLSLLPRDSAFSQSQQLVYAEDAAAIGMGQGHPRHGETGERSAVPSRRASIYSSVEWEPFGDADRGPGGSGPSSQVGSRRASIQNETNRPLHTVQASLQDAAALSMNTLQSAVKAPSMPELMRQDSLQRGLAARPNAAGYPTANAHYATHYSNPPPPAPVQYPQVHPQQPHPPPALAYRRGSAIAINMGGYEGPSTAPSHYAAVPYPGPVTGPYEWGYPVPVDGLYGQPYAPPPLIHQQQASSLPPQHYQSQQSAYQQHQPPQELQQHPHHHHQQHHQQQAPQHDSRYTDAGALYLPHPPLPPAHPQHTQYAPPQPPLPLQSASQNPLYPSTYDPEAASPPLSEYRRHEQNRASEHNK
ncbi:hypothetical protein BDZ88DRAFT_458596 [Geranomyces variabilis]|nr:hypothetical protein BDZ88DRAFT_458596 [Geranomyces variabilis]